MLASLQRLSLKLRVFLAALVLIAVFIPLTAIILERAFSTALAEAIQEQLEIQTLNLISNFEFEQEQANMPEFLFNEKLNVPESGRYAFILQNQRQIWQSQSAIGLGKLPAFPVPSLGHSLFTQAFSLSPHYFLYAYTAEFPFGDGYQVVSFVLIQDKSGFYAEISTFRRSLWYGLGLIALVLVALLLLSLNMALSPISQLIKQIKRAEQGEVARIDASYPPELEKLKSSLNHLLDAEQQQRQRYKNSLSDLAHSLKTPLAVIAGHDALPTSVQQPVSQIDNIIQRQLKRAVAGANIGWEQAEAVKPILTTLVDAMNKIYAHKTLSISLETHDQDKFKGDKTDLMELMGNILDNACKAAQDHVKVSSVTRDQYLFVRVEDDGPGIPAAQREALLNRGTRLDSYTEGQGIGMAVVADLIMAYQGKLEILDSNLGGAKIQLTLPV